MLLNDCQTNQISNRCVPELANQLAHTNSSCHTPIALATIQPHSGRIRATADGCIQHPAALCNAQLTDALPAACQHPMQHANKSLGCHMDASHVARAAKPPIQYEAWPEGCSPWLSRPLDVTTLGYPCANALDGEGCFRKEGIRQLITQHRHHQAQAVHGHHTHVQ